MILIIKDLKRTYLLCSFIAFFLLFVFNNSYSQAGASIGVKAGAGFSRYYFVVPSTQPIIYVNFVPVYQAGLVFNQINKKNLGVQVEFNFVQKAWEETIGESAKYRVVINNLELPFLSHFRIGHGKFGWIINMGMHLSYAFKADIDGSGFTSVNSLIPYYNLKYKPLDYGMDGGLGFEIGKEKGVFAVQIMFSQGMNNLFERDPEKVYRSLNQSLSLSCIYKIPLKFKKSEE